MNYVNIILACKKVTIIDESDYDMVSQWKWHLSDRGYAQRCQYISKINGKLKHKRIFLHRLILQPPENKCIDHINGDRLDNRRCNLRICDFKENARNSTKMKKSLSKYKGVTIDRDKWSSRITVDYKVIYLGTFDTEISAALAYNHAALMYFGEFAKLNIID